MLFYSKYKMATIQNNNIVKLIFSSFSLIKTYELSNKVQNKTLYNLILRIYSYKAIYRSMGKAKITIDDYDCFTNSICLLPDGNIISISWGIIITKWNAKDFSIIKTKEITGQNFSLAILKNSNIVISSSNELKIWDENIEYINL
jgi:hypothetical protein